MGNSEKEKEINDLKHLITSLGQSLVLIEEMKRPLAEKLGRLNDAISNIFDKKLQYEMELFDLEGKIKKITRKTTVPESEEEGLLRQLKQIL